MIAENPTGRSIQNQKLFQLAGKLDHAVSSQTIQETDRVVTPQTFSVRSSKSLAAARVQHYQVHFKNGTPDAVFDIWMGYTYQMDSPNEVGYDHVNHIIDSGDTALFEFTFGNEDIPCQIIEGYVIIAYLQVSGGWIKVAEIPSPEEGGMITQEYLSAVQPDDTDPCVDSWQIGAD